jgi:hypothetical protein
MKPKIKNTFNDVFFFICYHLLAVAFTVSMLLSLTLRIPLTDFDTLFSAMTSMSTAAAPVVARAQVEETIIQHIRGQVTIETKGAPATPATEGLVLAAGSTIVTGDKSSALLSFKGRYSWQVRLIPNTKFKLEELMQQRPDDKSENTLFALVQGGVILLLERMGQNVNMRIKTSSITYGVRGTQFSIVTDTTLYSILAVKKGSVEVENFKAMKKDMIAAGKVYFANNSGNIKVNEDRDILDAFDWDMEGPGLTDPDLQLLRERAEKLTTETSPEAQAKDQVTSGGPSAEQLREKLMQELDRFSRDQNDYSESLELMKTRLTNEEFAFLREEKQVETDLYCLRTTNGACQLQMEKLLIMRGFPATHGSPQLRNSIINDLVAYLGEKKEGIASLKQEIEGLEGLLRKRAEVLQSVRQEAAGSSDYPLLLKKLEDKDLKKDR